MSIVCETGKELSSECSKWLGCLIGLEDLHKSLLYEGKPLKEYFDKADIAEMKWENAKRERDSHKKHCIRCRIGGLN